MREDNKQEEKNIRDSAVSTIIDIWSAIDWDKVQRSRAISIWDEVTNKVKAAAMTNNSYEKFVEKLCRKLDVRSLKYNTINEITSKDDVYKRAILKLLREQTIGIMLEVRLNNQIRKEEREILKQKQEQIKKGACL